MTKKSLAQIILIFFTIILIIFLFYHLNINSSKYNQPKKEQSKKIENSNKDFNLIRGIEYISQDTSGNIYKIIAESGKNDSTDSNLIYLSVVDANIKLKNFKELEIISSYAEYNSFNNYTTFYDNVSLKFENNQITCDRIVLDFSQGIANLSDNIIFKNFESVMFLDKITIDLKNNITRMSMLKNSDKIRIISSNATN